MKNLHSRILLLASLFCLLALACKKDKDDDIYRVSNAPMTGAQENPDVSTNATGSFDATYDPASKKMTITVRWQNLSGNATLMHIHGPAPVGENAGVLHNFATLFTPTASGSFSTSFTLNGTTQTEADLLGGLWYVNIHTANHGGGEIRGQIVLNN